MSKEEDEFAAILAAYTAELPAKIAEIKLLLSSLVSKWNKDDLQKLHRCLHNLHGAAATFGYVKLSTAAMKFNDELHHCVADLKNSTRQTEREFQLLFDELKNASHEPDIKVIFPVDKNKG